MSLSTLLAVDAGGTSTRALLLDTAGTVLGYGRAGGGNPTSAGIAAAVDAIGRAAERASTGSAVPAVPGPALAVVAMAGEQTDAFTDQLVARLSGLRVGRVVLQHDLLGVFGSGTARLDGYALIAGTGSVAARVAGGRLDHVVGGRGWLLGDAGGGFWIGHRVARAVTADLDGQGEPTALTPLVLEHLQIPAPTDSGPSRVQVVRRLVSVLYAQRPVRLAELAPLAFAVPDDPVARSILAAAAEALTDLLAAVRDPHRPGPVVVGGSIVVHGLLAGPPERRPQLAAPGEEVIPVADGVVGAAVLALRETGVAVDDALFTRLRTRVATAVE